MITAQWDTLAVLFEQVIELPVEKRATFLDEACGKDETLRRELDSLLACYNQASPFFDSLESVVPVSREEEPIVDPFELIGEEVSRYRVEGLVGVGGMGVVYEAYDTELLRKVALKFLPPALSFDARARERFVAEARAASGLDHPNICTVHEIGRTEQGQIFIAMAYYEGETLKAKIARGKLPVNEVLDYARQIASGLKRAHEKGIVHRDIKPANVLVTHEGVVKVLDFGLAKIAEQQLTQTGATLGTVSYMSPEQARGEKVGPQTDVWSFGAVLYEMLSGKRAIAGPNQHVVIYKLLNEEVTPLGDHVTVTPEIAHLVSTCLEKSVADRYADMGAVQRELGLYQQVGAISLNRLRVPRLRRRMIGGVVAVLLLLVSLWPAARNNLLSAIGVGPELHENRILVLPFENALGESAESEAFAAGLQPSLVNVLKTIPVAESDSLWIVPAEEVAAKQVYTVEGARQFFGAQSVLHGRLYREKALIKVDLELFDLARDETMPVKTVSLVGPQHPDFQKEARLQLVALLEMEVSPEALVSPVEGPMLEPDAYAFYVQGLGYAQQKYDEEKLTMAVALYERAIGIDSLFAAAYAGSCEATWDRYVLNKSVALIAEAIAFCDKAVQLASGDVHTLVSLGRVLLLTGQAKKAEQTLFKALELEPSNADAYRWLGRVYEATSDDINAEEAYKQAIASKPNGPIYYADLGTFLHYNGRSEEASYQFEQVIQLTPDNHQGYALLAAARRNLGDLEDAKALYHQSIEIRPSTLAYRNLGQILIFYEQRYDEAILELEKAVTVNENDWWTWRWLGHAYHLSEDVDKERQAWQQMILITQSLLEVNPDDIDVLCAMAEAHFIAGDIASGRKYLDRLLAQSTDFDYAQYYLARIYEIIGNRSLAFNYLERALDLGYDVRLVQSDPWLDDLRTDDRFSLLIRSLERLPT